MLNVSFSVLAWSYTWWMSSPSVNSCDLYYPILFFFFHIAFISFLIILSHWDDSIGLHVKEALIRVVDRNRTKRVTLHRGFPCNFSFFKKYKFIYFNWRLITLHYYVGFAMHQQRIPEKYIFLLYSLCQSLWLCRSQ